MIFAGAGRRAGPDSMLIVCVSVCMCEIISRPLIGRKLVRLYDVARLLLMVLIEPWRNSTPVFGAAAFCTTKNDVFRASLTSPLRSGH